MLSLIKWVCLQLVLLYMVVLPFIDFFFLCAWFYFVPTCYWWMLALFALACAPRYFDGSDTDPSRDGTWPLIQRGPLWRMIRDYFSIQYFKLHGWLAGRSSTQRCSEEEGSWAEGAEDSQVVEEIAALSRPSTPSPRGLEQQEPSVPSPEVKEPQMHVPALRDLVARRVACWALDGGPALHDLLQRALPPGALALVSAWRLQVLRCRHPQQRTLTEPLPQQRDCTALAGPHPQQTALAEPHFQQKTMVESHSQQRDGGSAALALPRAVVKSAVDSAPLLGDFCLDGSSSSTLASPKALVTSRKNADPVACAGDCYVCSFMEAGLLYRKSNFVMY